MRNFTIILGLIFSLNHKAKADSPKCIAHRGEHSSELENSLGALSKAIESEIDGVEFDIRHTKDGKAILLHNRTLRWIAKSKPGKRCPRLPVSQLLYSEIKNSCLLHNGKEFNTLEQSLELLQGKTMTVFIELKDNPSSETIDLLHKFEADKSLNLRVISFKEDALYLVTQAQATKNVKTLLLSIDAPSKTVHSGISTHFYGKSEITKLKMSDKEFSVWTLNEVSDFKVAEKMGADYITTDRPLECSKYFAQQEAH